MSLLRTEAKNLIHDVREEVRFTIDLRGVPYLVCASSPPGREVGNSLRTVSSPLSTAAQSLEPLVFT